MFGVGPGFGRGRHNFGVAFRVPKFGVGFRVPKFGVGLHFHVDALLKCVCKMSTKPFW